MSRPTIIIAGLNELADTLDRTGVFARVVRVGGVSELLAAFGSADLAQRRPNEVVLVFADTLKEDHSLPLVEVIRRLTGAGYPVVIVSVTARGQDLSRQFPKAGLLPTPVRVNDLLYAVNTFGYAIEPIQETPQPQQSDGGWGAPPQSAPGPQDSKGGGWAAVQTEPSPRIETPRPVQQPAWGDRTPTAPTVEPSPPARRAPEQAPPQDGGRRALTPLFGTGRPDAAQPAAPAQPAPQQWGGQPATQQWGGQPGPGQPATQQWGGQPGPGQPVTQQWGGQPPYGGPVNREGAYNAVPQNVGRRGFVITIAVSKGGTGKSSLTLNLGAFLGMRLRMLGKTVCIIDANFQQADAGKYLDCWTPNINTIANDPALLTRERILEGLVHKPEYNLSVLLGPATPDEANPLNIDAELYSEILELLKVHFDYILIDTPVAEKFHDLFSKFVLPKADFIVVPVAPNLPTLHDAHNWLMSAVVQPRHSGGAGVDPSRIGVVLNRAEDGIGCSEEDVRSAMARWRFLGSIPETKEWKLANNRSELVAQKAYAELNQAFASVLYEATGEAVLGANIEPVEEKRGIKGLLGKIGKGRK